MKEKKNIDNLFKENFSGQEIAPPELVWTNIERELKKKKERKVFPIWWKFAGVAAVLLIGILIGKEFFGNKNSNIIPVSSIEIKSSLNKDIINQELKNKKNEVLVSNDHNEKSNNKSTSIKDKKNIIPKNEVLVSNERDELSNEKKANKLFSNKRKLILNRTNSIANNSIISNKNIYKDTNNTNDRKIAENNANNQIDKKESENKTENNFNKLDLDNKLFEQKNQLTTIENLPIKIDSLAKKTNVLENLLAEKNKKKTKESKAKKWQITPNIAPIYANSTSNNSTFDSKFNNNSKSNEKNISLGLAVNYAITKKISIRSGINKFDVGATTNNIGFYKNSATATGLNDETTIVSNEYAISNNLSNLPDITSLEVDIASGFLNQVASPNPTTKTEGTINQKSSYIEVPLEISYAIIDKKIGVNLITGFSTLFLNKNQVSLISNIENINLGQSDNLNKIHYSTNIGLGFNYKFAKSFQINLEPMLKYQINAFKNDLTDNRPYFFGIYSGISYQF